MLSLAWFRVKRLEVTTWRLSSTIGEGPTTDLMLESRLKPVRDRMNSELQQVAATRSRCNPHVNHVPSLRLRVYGDLLAAENQSKRRSIQNGRPRRGVGPSWRMSLESKT